VPPEGGSVETDIFAATIDASFELDVWGRLRRATEAAGAELLAGEATRQTVVMTLVSDIATAYLQLRELDLELDLELDHAPHRRVPAGVARHRPGALRGGAHVGAGRAPGRDGPGEHGGPDPGSRAADRADGEPAERPAGQEPGRCRPRPALAGQTLSPTVPAGLPSALLERRPDIRQAEQTLVAANARIGVAKAAFFPQISLTGFFGVESVALSDFFTGPARVWQVGPAVTLPIFNAGRNRANVQLTEAQQQEALPRYEQAIQQAFREVEDALIAHRKAREALIEQSRAVRSSRETLGSAELRYTSGLTTYLDVLDAQRTLLAAEVAESRTLLAQLVSVVQRYRALGGGWDAAPGAGKAARGS
jgi:multidrug efflux system outer membrane protein